MVKKTGSASTRSTKSARKTRSTARSSKSPKLKKELKPGTRIVSQSFNMGEEWPPEKTIDVDGRPVYLWTIK